MKLKDSEFICEAKPAAKKLLGILLGKYEYASILAVDAHGKNYRVSAAGTDIASSPMYTSRGFVARVYLDGACFEYSFDMLSDGNLDEIAKKIDSIAQRKIESAGSFAAMKTPAPVDTPCVLHESTELGIDPEELGDDKIISKLTELRTNALKSDERLIDVIAICSYRKYSKMFLSRNRDMTQNVIWTTGGVDAVAKRGDEIKECYKPVSILGGVEILSALDDEVKSSVEGAIALLSAESMIPGEYECICTPEVTGMIVHEAFGHGVEMDMFVKKRALAEKYVGRRVASDLVTMHDGAGAAKQTATFLFDDEGTLAHDTVVIEKGILKRGICDARSAAILGCEATGNGRRESFERKAYTRMTNTYFEGGSDKLEDMIASIKYGFLLSDASSGMEDPKNWGIQCMVSAAREIKDGKLTGKIFSPVVLTGYVPDLLKSISMMSENVELSGSGFCGKGHKEWVKVSDGGPYIKARVCLG